MQNTTFMHGMMYIEKSICMSFLSLKLLNTRDKNYNLNTSLVETEVTPNRSK